MEWEPTCYLKFEKAVLMQRWDYIGWKNDGHGSMEPFTEKSEWRPV